ncbi:alpha/beta hydrolase family protein [Actinophytocola sp.]|uniref:alpha/beta hydrolase n=1 Tax=Actinophytocola sp. TaxID=1872138 RepID=UPI002D6D6D1C|nr:alpha/beta hydrolase family protein [Actinophytocola sp.]HYQ62343.1 alpha/beta hydrolase family protein [Actinophytocola sp.]
MRSKRGVALVGLLALAAGVLSTPPAIAAAPATATAVSADDGATVVQETRIDARTLDLKINSPALGTTGMVRVLLPQGWDSQPTRTWPQVWLMHGCCEPADYQSWTQFTDVEELTASSPVMVVMPTDGSAGMFSAWWNFGLSNKPDWETFHVTEVRQILERGYRAGTQRAIAGISIGGFGAMHYAFRHPGMFLTAASYSGVLDTMGFGIPAILKAILIREGFFNYLLLWGSEFLNPSLWHSHNPADNLEKLRGTALYVSSGNGVAGPFDPGTSNEGGDFLLEPSAQSATQTFVNRAQQLGIPVTADFYGPGTHSWPYWERELHRSWAFLTARLGV